MGGIGDFAEMLINQQIAGTSPSVQKTSNVKQRDISRVEVPNDLMRDILSESFDVKVPEQEEVVEETVETTVQPINEDMLLTESNRKGAYPLNSRIKRTFIRNDYCWNDGR